MTCAANSSARREAGAHALRALNVPRQASLRPSGKERSRAARAGRWENLLKRALLLVLALFLASPAGARAADPLDVNVILSLTGSAAVLGKPELQAISTAVDVTNRNGGVRGRPLRLVAVDDQSNPQVALTLANQIMARHAAFFLGPNLTAPCAAITPILQGNAVDYCLSPGINPARGSFVFSAGNSTDDDMIVMIRYFRLRGWSRIALITTTDASGQAIDRGTALALSLPENHAVDLVAHEHFALADLSVNAQMAHIKSLNPQVVIAWATGAPFGTLLHGLRDTGIELPIGAGSGNLVYAQLQSYGSLMPKETYFPGVALLSPSSVLPGPIHDAQAAFLKLYASNGERPEFLSTLAWDPVMIVFDALKALGPDATAEQLRAHIAGLHSWVGINGVYDFRDGAQRGIGQNTCVIDRWDAAAGRIVAASRPGGYLH
jgi:branched-chain amino acid transport system substrate-binding protein